MFIRKHPRFKKIITLTVVFFFVFQLILPAVMFSFSTAANAQFGVIATNPDRVAQEAAQTAVDAAKEAAKEAKTTVWKKLKDTLIMTVSITLKNTLVNLAQKAAEASLTYMTTGDWGESSMFFEQAFDEMVDDIQTYTVGAFLDGINDILGVDLCNPSNYSVKLDIILGLDMQGKKGTPGAPRKKPDCTFQKLAGNWEAFAKEMEAKYKEFEKDPATASLAMLQESTRVSFGKQETGIGTFISLEDKMNQQKTKAEQAELLTRKEGQGAKGLTALIGKIKTPAFFTKKSSEEEMVAGKRISKQEAKTSSDVIADIPEQVVMAFLSTFASKAFEAFLNSKYFKKGLVDPAQSYQPGQYVFDTKSQLKKELAMHKIDFSFSPKQINLLSEFTNCPQDDSARQLNNCVMDSNFAQAVLEAGQDEPISVADALGDRGGLNGGWSIVGKGNLEDSSANCFQNNYCYSNLVKLRKARIIPIGWEIAATIVGEDSNVTLMDVVADFNNEDSKYYHLIDPNWILKYPHAQCNAEVSGQLLTGPQTDTRAQTCVDMPTCIRTNELGACESWGYCAAEKNIFRMGGDSCLGVYDSCSTLIGRDKSNAGYLMNTVDKTGCDPNSVGCKWFSLIRDTDLNWVNDDDNKIFLNKLIETQECPPGAAGCNRFIKTTAGLGTNLIPNGDFEIFDGDETNLDTDELLAVPGWLEEQALTADSDGGNAALVIIDKTVQSTIVHLAPKSHERYFAVSVDFKKQDWVSSSVFNVDIDTVVGEHESIYYNEEEFNNAQIGEWLNIVRIFKVNRGLSGTAEIIVLPPAISVEFSVGNGTIILDNVMLEELDTPALTAMHNFNDYASKNPEYVKKAPEYLNCYNAKVTEATGVQDEQYGRPYRDSLIHRDDDAVGSDTVKGCKAYAQLCSAEEVGCEAYQPTDDGSLINGVTSFYDYCPQECAGYQTFNKSETYFEDQDFPVYFIPETGATCSSAESGCEEFTNLDELVVGGEAKEYYSELKQCAKLPEEDSTCENFYTWEGSEVTGYQLQAYYLKEANSGPAVTLDDVSDICNKTIFDAKSSPDCRQFYNEAGQVFYLPMTKTVTCSENCHPYRRSLQYETASECEERQGEWKSNECIFMAIPNEGRVCSEPNAGCREYKGNMAGVQHEIENYTFSEYKNAESDLDELLSSSATVKLDPEFGYYLQVSSGDGLGDATNEGPRLYTDPDSIDIYDLGTYRLSFWLKRVEAGSHIFRVDIRDQNSITTGSSIYNLTETPVTLPEDWTFYSYQFDVDDDFSNDYVVGITAYNSFQIDNFKLVKTEDIQYIIKDSWLTPDSCDQDLGGADVEYAQVGCREFKDPEDNTHYLKSFSGLCDAEKVGCEALIDTNNNVYPFEKTYNTEKPFSCDAHENVTLGDVAGGDNDTLSRLLNDSSIRNSFDTYLLEIYDIPFLALGGFTSACTYDTCPAFDEGTIGNGVCDFDNRTEACNYDGGDCCEATCKPSGELGGNCLTADSGNCWNPCVDPDQDEWVDLNPKDDIPDAAYCTDESACLISMGVDLPYLDALSEPEPEDDDNNAGGFMGTGGLGDDGSSSSAYFAEASMFEITCEDAVAGLEAMCVNEGYAWDDENNFCIYPSNYTVNADSLIYLVVNNQSKCLDFEKGCTELGAPELTVVPENVYQQDNSCNAADDNHACLTDDGTIAGTDSNGKFGNGTYLYSSGDDACASIGKLCIETEWNCDSVDGTSNGFIKSTLDCSYPRTVGADDPCVLRAVCSGAETFIEKYVVAEEEVTLADKSKVMEKQWNNLHYILDPELFDEDETINPLCQVSAAGCEEYKDAENQEVLYYFKTPGDKLCEYRKGVIGSENIFAWFKKGRKAVEANLCDTQEYYQDGIPNIIRNTDYTYSGTANGDVYSGWAAACPNSANKCTSFVDPTDKIISVLGKAYYYLNNEKIDKGECSTVGRKEGCVLFNDTSLTDDGEPVLTYNAYEAYTATKTEGMRVSAKIEDTDWDSIEWNNMPIDSGNGLLGSQVKAIVDGASCAEYKYCTKMAECLQQELTPDVCMKEVFQTDADYGLVDHQFYCQSVLTPGNLDDKMVDAVKNAFCTAKRIMVNDTNTIIKVARDRECAAWYDCKSSHWAWDESQARYVEVCDKLGLCDKLSSESDTDACVHFVNNEDDQNLLSQNVPFDEIFSDNNTPFDLDDDKLQYAVRSTGWFNLDYTGIAIPSMAPLQFYDAFDIEQGEQKKTCGGVAVSTATECTTDVDCGSGQSCDIVKDFRLVNQTNQYCDVTDDPVADEYGCDEYESCLDGANNICKCLNNICVLPFYGTDSTFSASPNPTCRAYPEETSPFPSGLKNNRIFENAYLMNTDDKQSENDYACNYRKVTYGNGSITKYFPKYPEYSPSTPPGFCQDDVDLPCSSVATSGDLIIDNNTMFSSEACGGVIDTGYGICMRKDAEDVMQYIGWQGYCLEQDQSLAKDGNAEEHPCLTWYPTQSLSGLQDLQNQYEDAGFNPMAYGYTDGGPYYCKEAERWEFRKAFEVMNEGWLDCDGDRDNGVIVIPSSLFNAGSVFLDKKWHMDGTEAACKDGAKWPSNAKDENGELLPQYAAGCILDNGGKEKYNVCYSETADPTSLWDCQNNNCSGQPVNGGTKLKKPQDVCPYGYKAMSLHAVHRHKKNAGCCDREDKYRWYYECVPVLPNGDVVKQGWFHDPDGSIASTNTKLADTGEAGIVTETEHWTCDEFYSVGDSNINKAYTDKIYQGAPVKGGKMGTIPKALACPWYGAMAYGGKGTDISATLSNDEKSGPYNLFLSSMKCNDDSPTASKIGKYCSSDKDCGAGSYMENEDPMSMKYCTIPGDKFTDCEDLANAVLDTPKGGELAFDALTLQELFAKAYGKWWYVLGESESGICMSPYASINGDACDTSLDCGGDSVAIDDECSEVSLGTCENDPDEYCYVPADCGGADCRTINPTDLPDHPPQNGDACPNNGVKVISNLFMGDYPVDDDVEEGDFDDADYEDQENCVQYWHVIAVDKCCGADCNDPVAIETVVEPLGAKTFCTTELKYSSDQPETFYEQVSDDGWDDQSGTVDHTPPVVSAVISTGKKDDNGNNLYTALPNKITVGTQDLSKNAGDISGVNGQLEVFVKFYAWADDDQMPIRQVNVDWGDNNSTSPVGKFQNHKPRCQRYENEPLGRCLSGIGGILYNGYPCTGGSGADYCGEADSTHACISNEEEEPKLVVDGNEACAAIGKTCVGVQYSYHSNPNQDDPVWLNAGLGEYDCTMGELETGEKLDKVYRAICEGGIIGEAEGCEFLGSNPICMDVRPHFGDTSGDASYNINNACIEGYFRFNNTYTCENPSSLVFDCDDYPDKSPCKYLDTSGNYSCRYRIGVQVKDSWGWCNADHWSTKLIGQGSAGDMEPTVIGTEGYWADGAEDNCKYNSNAYEYYDGYIYVSP